MATVYDLLLARYMNAAHLTRATDVPAADLAFIQQTAVTQSGDLKSASEAVISLGAAGSTNVAVLAYQFFTGATPKAEGLDYLILPTGPNPNNLNSAYYQHFNIENRFINFAVNLGKLGEGRAAFEAAYGALSLADAVTKAYTEILGHAPVAGKVADILGAAVPNGLGGTYTRADYFAFYGLDGPNGIGTKAAAIGWLLEISLQGEGGGRFTPLTFGPYASAVQAYALDLGYDGQAQFHTNMLTDYGPGGAYLPNGLKDAGYPGVTIMVGPNGVNAPTGYLTGYTTTGYSTDGNDTISAPNGLNGPEQAVYAGGGNDVISVGGTMASYIFAGDGNDVINIVSFGGVIALGAVNNGSGYDVVNLGGLAPLPLDSLGNVVTTFGRLPNLGGLIKGQDHLNFDSAFGPGAAVVADFSGATSIDAPLAYVSARTAAGANSVFEYKGDTYVYHQDATPGVDAGDSLLWIPGAVGYTVANGAATGDIHFS